MLRDHLSEQPCTALIDMGEGITYITDLLEGYARIPVAGKHQEIDLEPFGYRWLRMNRER